METRYSPQNRTERLVAGGRVVLAVTSLVAVWLDPTEPARNPELVYGLLAAYVAYSLLVGVVVWRTWAPHATQRLLTHAIDLAVFSGFVYLSASVSSPFVAFFVFSMICGTLRWGWRGSLLSAAAVLASFLGLGLWFNLTEPSREFDLQAFVIRGVYLAVVAVLLASMGRHEERVRFEIGRLAAWPRPVAGSVESLASDLLRWAREVLDAPRALLLWEEREEPERYLAILNGSGFATEKVGPGALRPVVDPALDESVFLAPDARDGPTNALRSDERGLSTWTGRPLHSELLRRFGVGPWLSAPLQGDTFTGRLFLVGKPGMTSDDVDLAQVVAGVATSRLDHHYLLRSLAATAATEERIRVARDLHDGVLQSLTGIALRLAVTAKRFEVDPEGAKSDLEDIRRLIVMEQKDLRLFIDDLKPQSLVGSTVGPGLVERLRELSARAEIEWNVGVSIGTEELGADVPDPMAREVYLLVREALVNAVRHGAATEVSVEVRRSPAGEVEVHVADNGRGFPFQGVFSGEDLKDRNIGPKTLQERVASLRGRLRLESREGGAKLELVLPAARVGG